MMMYEVWGRAGKISAHADKGLANKAFRRQDAPAALTLGASLLAVRDGTTPKQRAAIEHAVALAHAGDAKIDVPKPDPAREKTHRTPLVARRPVEVDDDDTDVETEEREPETDGDDDEDELPTADAPRDPEPAVERLAAPAPTPSAEVPMAAPFQRDPCATRGCKRPIGIVRANTPAWGRDICSRCRVRARSALRDGTTTEANLTAYLSGDRSALPSAKRDAVPAPCKAPVTRPAATTADAVELCDGSIQVTIALPPYVARAAACAARLGGIDALEQLVNAILAVRP